MPWGYPLERWVIGQELLIEHDLFVFSPQFTKSWL
jgi:hypothetical protein